MASDNVSAWELAAVMALGLSQDPASADGPSSPLTTVPGDEGKWPCPVFKVLNHSINGSCETVFPECARLSEHLKRVHAKDIDLGPIRLLTRKKSYKTPQEKWEAIQDCVARQLAQKGQLAVSSGQQQS